MEALETARLTLRLVTPADAGLLYELDSDPEVMRYLSGGPGTPMELIRAEILPRFLDYSRHAPWAGAWLAFENHTSGFVGWFSLRRGPDIAAGAELGYRLRRSSWGRGLATEGAAALLERAFSCFALPRAFAITYEDNAASRRVMEKLGMTIVARRRPSVGELIAPTTFQATGGEPWLGDDIEYGVDAAHWRTPSVPSV